MLTVFDSPWPVIPFFLLQLERKGGPLGVHPHGDFESKAGKQKGQGRISREVVRFVS